MKSINILGSTGSIGTNTLSIIAQNPDHFTINLLSAGSNHKEFANQIIKFQPKYAYLADENARYQLPHFPNTKLITDIKEYYEILAAPHDISICAIMGSAALVPTTYAIKGCKRLGLANKEVVICAYPFLKQKIDENDVDLIPLDSEHNAIYQLIGYDLQNVENVIITASGGPFYGKPLSKFYDAKKDEAIAHPNWSMGAKISVDSATMMNKGLEFIEACELFNLKASQVKILVHRQSKVHAIVNFEDGSSFLQINESDMKVHISQALKEGGARCMNLKNKPFDLTATQLTFEELDEKNFSLPRLAHDVYESGDLSMRINMNNTNEKLVNQFLKGEIKFGEIIDFLHQRMQNHNSVSINNMADILEYMDSLHHIHHIHHI